MSSIKVIAVGKSSCVKELGKGLIRYRLKEGGQANTEYRRKLDIPRKHYSLGEMNVQAVAGVRLRAYLFVQVQCHTSSSKLKEALPMREH